MINIWNIPLRIRKITIFVIVITLQYNLFADIGFEDLVKSTVIQNQDIRSSKADFQKYSLAYKTLDGFYSPEISLSSAITTSDIYNFSELPDVLKSNITYTQPIPGGASFSISTNYDFLSYNYQEERFIEQNPYLSITFNQSLMPYWVQGESKDCIKQYGNQEKEISYNQFLYSKNNALLNLLKYYIYALISLNDIKMYQNTVSLYELQIDAYSKLKTSGSINQTTILEIHNSKWNAQQNLITAQTSYSEYIRNLKSISGQDFDETNLEHTLPSDIDKILSEYIENYDPLEKSYKIKMDNIRTSRVLNKQTNAPMLSFSFQPSWILESVKKTEWKEAWKGNDNTKTWSANIALNLTPLISDISRKNKEKSKLDYEEAKDTYNSYIREKKTILQQYETLLAHYSELSKSINFLYESDEKKLQEFRSQLEIGAISPIDFEIISTRVENLQLSKKSVDLYIELYSLLRKLY